MEEEENTEFISIKKITELNSINFDENIRLLVERPVDKLNVAFSSNINNLGEIFITLNKIKNMESLLSSFKKDIENTVKEFKEAAYLDDNKYILIEDSNRKRSELITYNKLTEIMQNYIKEDELETSLEECKEFASSSASSIIASLVSPAVMSRTTMYEEKCAAKLNEELTNAITSSAETEDTE